jgi:hypothetical protein
VLDDIDAGTKLSDIAQKFGVSKTTIYDIFKRRQELRTTKVTKNNFWRKVMKQPRYPQLESELLQWCLSQRKFPLSLVLIADKAMCLYETLELEGNFKPSSTWAKKFVLRHPELCEKQGMPVDEEFSAADLSNLEMVQEFDGEQAFGDEDISGSFEFMKADEISSEYQEEYLIDDLNPPQEDELQTQIKSELEEEQVVSPKKVLKIIKKDDASNVMPIPEEIALKSLKILMKYSEQQGHDDMLSQLMEYQQQLQENDL